MYSVQNEHNTTHYVIKPNAESPVVLGNTELLVNYYDTGVTKAIMDIALRFVMTSYYLLSHGVIEI